MFKRPNPFPTRRLLDHDANATAASSAPPQSAADASGPAVPGTAATPHAANDGRWPATAADERNDEHGNVRTAVALHESTDAAARPTATTAAAATLAGRWPLDASATVATTAPSSAATTSATAGWSPAGCSPAVRQPAAAAAERSAPAMYPARMPEPGDCQFRLGG